MARPKGSKDKAPRKWPSRFIGETIPAGKSPLEYMLAVMNDEKADMLRRDKMALAAAPYIHAKIAEKSSSDGPVQVFVGKKAQVSAAAASAGEGTEWGDDLKSEVAN